MCENRVMLKVEDRNTTRYINPDKITYAVVRYKNAGGLGWVVELYLDGDDSPCIIPVSSKEAGEKILNDIFKLYEVGEEQ